MHYPESPKVTKQGYQQSRHPGMPYGIRIFNLNKINTCEYLYKATWIYFNISPELGTCMYYKKKYKPKKYIFSK